MKFTSKKLSEKLVMMGCKPHPEYLLGYGIFEPNYTDCPTSYMNDIPAFCLEDFVGTHEQAKENAKIAWGDSEFEGLQDFGCVGCNEGACGESFAWHQRHAIIDSEDWISYLEETMRKE